MLLLVILNPFIIDSVLSKATSEMLTPTQYANSALNEFLEYFLALGG
jgi:hypothetical protein